MRWTIEETLALGEQHIATGVTHFTLGISGPDYDMTTLRQLVEWRDRLNG